MGIRNKSTQNTVLKRNSKIQYQYVMNDDGKLERIPVVDETPTMSDAAWNFDALNDDYYTAYQDFDKEVESLAKQHSLESIDITALGVGVVVDGGNNKYRHEVSQLWCSPPCEEFRKSGTCKHIKAMEAHNDAMNILLSKVADADDPDNAANRFATNYANPENIILMPEDEAKLAQLIKEQEKYEAIFLAKDDEGNAGIWGRPIDADVKEDGSSDDDALLVELDPIYKEKIENMDCIQPNEGFTVQLRNLALDDGKEHPVAIVSELDDYHRKIDEIKNTIIERIENSGKVGVVSPDEGINSDIAELAGLAAKWPQLPQEYHDFVELGRKEFTKEEIKAMDTEERLKYQKAKDLAEKIPSALDKTFMIKGWRESMEQFSEYYTERKVGEDILSVDLFGPYGSGKTYFAEVIAELNQQPFYKIEASRDLDLQSQFIVTSKQYNPETGQTELVAQKAGLAQALEMAQGSVVLLDESVQMNTADQRLLNSVIQNAKYTTTMSAEDGFTTHKVNRKTVLFTAHNTDMAGEGVAADNDPSLSSRQATAIYFPPAPKEVKAIQMVRYAANMTGEKPVDPKKAMLMVEFLDKLKPLYTGETGERLFRMPPNDPRDEKRIGIILARYCHKSASSDDLRKAAEIILRTVVNKYTDKSDEEALPKAREAVLQAFAQVMDNPQFPFKWREMSEAIEKGIKWSDAEDSTYDGFDYGY